MALTKEQKQVIINDYATKDGDTGSAEVQIAILTREINDLNGHLQIHIHDFHSKRGLFQKIGRRKRLMTYLKNKNLSRYTELIQKLGLRG